MGSVMTSTKGEQGDAGRLGRCWEDLTKGRELGSGIKPLSTSAND